MGMNNGICRLIVVAASLIISGSEAFARQRYGGPYLTDVAVVGIESDLALSEAQRSWWNEFLDEYRKAIATYEKESRATLKDWKREFWLTLVPELDESVDISHLPVGEQIKITMMRKKWEKGVTPSGVMTPTDAERRNAKQIEFGTSLYIHERENREQVLTRLRGILAETQLERWPVAMRRLEINIEDQNPEGLKTLDDPRWKVDLLRMLREATEEDAELHEIADAVRVPDIVLMNEHVDESMADLARIVLTFEDAYARALDDFSWKKLSNLYESSPLYNRGEMEAVRKLEAEQLELERRVWKIRVRFVENVGQYTSELLGVDAQRQWNRRWSEQFCPVLFFEESTDILYTNILALDGLEPERLDALKAVYEPHDTWRKEFKLRMVKLEIEESYTTNRYDEGWERDVRRLKDTYETRHQRAAQVNQRLRALLPPEHQTAFDEWLAEYRKKPTLSYKGFSVRP